MKLRPSLTIKRYAVICCLFFQSHLKAEVNSLPEHLLNIKSENLINKSFFGKDTLNDAAKGIYVEPKSEDKEQEDFSLDGISIISGSKKMISQTISSSITDDQSLDDYATYEGELVISSQGLKRKINYRFYKNLHEGVRKPLILILPPIMGKSPVDLGVASLLAKNGSNVLIPQIEDIFVPGKTISEVRKGSLETLANVRILLHHYLDTQTDIDQTRVGVFGVSLGGIFAATLIGLESRLTHAYLLVGGGDLPTISLYSLQDRILQFRKDNMNYFSRESVGAFSESWKDVTSKKFTFDPLSFSQHAKGKKIFMLMSTVDTTIPFANQVALWNAFGRPAYELSNLSHIGTVIRWFMRNRYHVVNFMKD